MEAQPQQGPYRAYHEAAEEAGKAHREGNFEYALEQSLKAHKKLTGQDFDPKHPDADIAPLSDEAKQLAAHNLTDIGARYERRGDDGDDGLAVEAVKAAARIQVDLLRRNTDPSGNDKLNELRRDWAVSQFYLGAFALKAAISNELDGEPVPDNRKNDILSYMASSAATLDTAAKQDGKKYHQYHINAMGRFAMAEGLYGSWACGVELGLRACWMALFSEPTLPPKERGRAVTKALVRGMGAVAISALSLFSARKPALKAAKRLL